jgi:hypothetical protein
LVMKILELKKNLIYFERFIWHQKWIVKEYDYLIVLFLNYLFRFTTK